MPDFNQAPLQGQHSKQFDAADIRERIHADAEGFVRWLYGGRAAIKRGEARIGNVRGEAGESLVVELTGDKAGLWHDHATGESGDLIGLYQAYRGGKSNFPQTLRELAVSFLHDTDPLPSYSASSYGVEDQQKADAERMGTKPAAGSDEPLGAPDRTFTYYDACGKVYARVARFESTATRPKKTFVQYSLRGGVWVAKAPERPILYRLPDVMRAETVVLCEGEGKADALASLEICATSAPGGANVDVDRIDWTPLAGKTVVIWPDNDAPGFKYARAAAAKLLALGCKVVGVSPPEGVAEGWDACDCVSEGGDPRALISNAKPVAVEEKGQAQQSAPRPNKLPNDIITEDSAAVDFVEAHVDDLRYCHSTGAWFTWNGNIWRREEKQIAFHWARLLARRLAENQDKRIRGAAGKTAFASGVEKFAQRDPAMAVTAENWDQDPWLLGTPTGVVDLRTGGLRPSSQAYGITKATLVAPANSGCPRWLKYLAESTGDNVELIRFLQQWLGYCLTGSVREHALVFVYGAGGNGKGVFINTVTKIMGDYATAAAMETFTASKHDRHPTDLAKLRGARIVTASETEQGHAWAESRIKALTGGDRISARFMRQDFFEYDPQFKLTIIGNHQPVLRNVDDAMRRRINMIPFLLKPPVVDFQLEAKLLSEAAGILQWMVEGCLDWQANGLVRPEIVKAATDDYFAEQDIFGRWLDECCDVQLGVGRVWDLSSRLFESWSDYSRNAGEAAGTQRAFAGELRKRGVEPYKAGGGVRAFKGVRLKLVEESAGSGAINFNNAPLQYR